MENLQKQSLSWPKEMSEYIFLKIKVSFNSFCECKLVELEIINNIKWPKIRVSWD